MRNVLLAVLLIGATDAPSFELPASAQKLFDDGTWGDVPAGFKIITLSHLADGCVGQAKAKPEFVTEARDCVANALRVARTLPRSDDGLSVSHLNLIYGAADQLGACADEDAHRRLSEALARRSLADPTKHLPSYVKLPFRWPADQTATLASLARFDAAHDGHTLDEPLNAWRDFMKKHLDPKTGLPESEVTGKAPGAKYPRGCAQSFITRYLNEADPALAHEWWEKYRAHHLTRLGAIVGFREWPRGVEKKGDIDSGPIVFGIGAAASAFAIAASKAQGDSALALQLEASASTALMLGAGGKQAEGVLPQAIQFQGRWQPTK
ncbi:MAG: hypothetical protein ACO1OB_18760 [Archangium sp.]